MELVLYKNIIVNPAICGGKPIFQGTRLTVRTILEFILAGDNDEDILEAYPFISKEDINTTREFSLVALEKGIHGILPIGRVA